MEQPIELLPKDPLVQAAAARELRNHLLKRDPLPPFDLVVAAVESEEMAAHHQMDYNSGEAEEELHHHN